MNVDIVKSNRRSISISIDGNANVHVKAPYFLDDEQIKLYINKKIQWINSKLEQVLDNNASFNDYINLKRVFIVGDTFDIQYAEINKATLIENVLLLPDKYRNNLQNTKLCVAKYIKQQANLYLPQIISTLGTQLGLCPSKIVIGGSRGRWGSCDANNRISINFRTIQLPRYLIDYIVVHELMHMKQLNHSKNFWTLVKNAYPEYAQARQELKQYGFLLKI